MDIHHTLDEAIEHFESALAFHQDKFNLSYERTPLPWQPEMDLFFAAESGINSLQVGDRPGSPSTKEWPTVFDSDIDAYLPFALQFCALIEWFTDIRNEFYGVGIAEAIMFHNYVHIFYRYAMEHGLDYFVYEIQTLYSNFDDYISGFPERWWCFLFPCVRLSIKKDLPIMLMRDGDDEVELQALTYEDVQNLDADVPPLV